MRRRSRLRTAYAYLIAGAALIFVACAGSSTAVSGTVTASIGWRLVT